MRLFKDIYKYVENFTIDKIHHLEKKIDYFFKKDLLNYQQALKSNNLSDLLEVCNKSYNP